MGPHARRGNSHRRARGENQSEAQQRRRLRAKPTRRACVVYVRERDEDCCRLCGRHVQYADLERDDHGEVHEFVFRSLGGSDVEPTNCVLVCKSCHTRHEPCVHPGIGHRSRRVIVPLDDDALMEGPISYRIDNFDDPQPLDDEIDRAARAA